MASDDDSEKVVVTKLDSTPPRLKRIGKLENLNWKEIFVLKFVR